MYLRHIHQEPELKEWLGIFEYVCERVRIGEENCIKFYIYSKEQGHNEAHLHAEYKDKWIVLRIPDGKVLEGSLRGKQQKQAIEWVQNNQEYLKSRWNELVCNPIYVFA